MKNKLENRYIWLDGEIIHLSEAKINILTPTSQFGANVFEGIRCYWNKDENQLYAFRLEDHFKRLKSSQKMLKIDDKYTLNELREAFISVIKKEDYRENIAVRQTIFIDGFGTWSSRGPVNMFIAPIPKGNISNEYNKKGLDCCIATWRRISDQSLSPRIKCGANYINSRMAQLEALDNGYDTAILLNDQGKAAEGPGSCLFIIRNGKLITPAVSSSILESITRDTIITISKDMGLEIEEREIDRTELYMCDEAFLCGSAMDITPIKSIDRYSITKDIGPITSQLSKAYLDIVKGNNKVYEKWLTAIY